MRPVHLLIRTGNKPHSTLQSEAERRAGPPWAPSPCDPAVGLRCPRSRTQRILEDEDSALPATLVRPRTGALCWFLDEAAARLLSVPFEKHSTL